MANLYYKYGICLGQIEKIVWNKAVFTMPDLTEELEQDIWDGASQMIEEEGNRYTGVLGYRCHENAAYLSGYLENQGWETELQYGKMKADVEFLVRRKMSGNEGDPFFGPESILEEAEREEVKLPIHSWIEASKEGENYIADFLIDDIDLGGVSIHDFELVFPEDDPALGDKIEFQDVGSRYDIFGEQFVTVPREGFHPPYIRRIRS